MRRYSRKRDENEPEIVAALQLVGASVTRLNADGVPDLLVGYSGATFLLEVKLPLGPRGGKRSGGAAAPGVGGDGVLSESQRKWWSTWRGTSVPIVRSPAEALAAIGVVQESDTPGMVQPQTVGKASDAT